MNVPPLSKDYADAVIWLQDVIRRAIDGTVPPLFVDYTNSRVLVGSTTASGSNNLQVFSGHLQVVSTGFGVKFPDGTTQMTSGVTATAASADTLARLAAFASQDWT